MNFVARHGERADLSKDMTEQKKIRVEFDPHLTNIGKQQASTTGKQILKFMQQCEFQNKPTLVMSSPFLRCVMTAIEIAKELPQIHENSIFIQHQICEYLLRSDFRENPIRFLLNSTQLNELKDCPFKINQEGFVKKGKNKFPEELDDICERIDNFIIELETQLNQTFEDYNVIWVSHRACVELALAMHTNDEHNTDIGYCGLVAIKIEKGKRTLFQDGSNIHLDLQ